MSDEPKILFIDDDMQIQRTLRKILAENGFQVAIAATGEDALVQAADFRPDVIILDLGLPDMDGARVCEQLRTWTQTPILVLSARHEQREKVTALDMGADDYLTKPFSVDELLARLRVALRHSARLKTLAEAMVQSGDIVIDLVQRLVTRRGQDVRLTTTEFKLLAVLARNADRVLTHRAILSAVWGPDYGEQVEYLRVFMRQLRTKLEDDPSRPVILLTEPGVGYRFASR